METLCSDLGLEFGGFGPTAKKTVKRKGKKTLKINFSLSFLSFLSGGARGEGVTGGEKKKLNDVGSGMMRDPETETTITDRPT